MKVFVQIFILSSGRLVEVLSNLISSLQSRILKTAPSLSIFPFKQTNKQAKVSRAPSWEPGALTAVDHTTVIHSHQGQVTLLLHAFSHSQRQLPEQLRKFTKAYVSAFRNFLTIKAAYAFNELPQNADDIAFLVLRSP